MVKIYHFLKSKKNNNFLEYDASNESGSSGSPIIRKYNLKYIIGIHHSSDKKKVIMVLHLIQY